jgi:hypothetical protein
MTDIHRIDKNIRWIKGKRDLKGVGLHTVNQRKHALNRLKERYGITATEKQYWDMVNMIKNQSPKATFIDDQGKRMTRWVLEWNQKVVFCVYDKKTKAIRTFLALEWLSKVKGQQ